MYIKYLEMKQNEQNWEKRFQMQLLQFYHKTDN